MPTNLARGSSDVKGWHKKKKKRRQKLLFLPFWSPCSRDVGREIVGEECTAEFFLLAQAGHSCGRRQSCCNYGLFIHLLIFLLPLIPGFFCQGGRFIYDRTGQCFYIFPSRLAHNLAHSSQRTEGNFRGKTMQAKMGQQHLTVFSILRWEH